VSILTLLRFLEYLEQSRKLQQQARCYALHIAVFGGKYEMSTFLALYAVECYEIMRQSAYYLELLYVRLRYPFPARFDG